MTMDTALGRSRLIARSTPAPVRRIDSFAVVCIFSIAGLILAALGLTLVRSEELAQILAMMG